MLLLHCASEFLQVRDPPPPSPLAPFKVIILQLLNTILKSLQLW